MKGIFSKNFPKPKYDVMWDPNLVPDYIKIMGKNKDVSLKDLTLKSEVLVALTSQQPVQTIVSLYRHE